MNTGEKIANIITNSKEVNDGDIFFCNSKARSFLTEDILKKAMLVVLEGEADSHKIDLKYKEKVKFVSNFQEELTKALQQRYTLPKYISAITGTKGKTSTAWFVFQLLTLNKVNTCYIGTIGIFYSINGVVEQLEKNNTLTTLAIDDLYRKLAYFTGIGIENAILEASSHGLEQGRLAGIDMFTTCFTNFSQDHLDYHGSMEEYFATKVLLFTKYQKIHQNVILNMDIPEFDKLYNICQERGLNISHFGSKDGSDLHFAISNNRVIKFKFNGKNYKTLFNIIGNFQVSNLSAAMLICIKYGLTIDNIIAKIQEVVAPIGRMERVIIDSKHYDIFIDYAHTPDSLQKALECLQTLNKKIITVFGCGGDRDKTKRPIMGSIAYKLSDIVILTEDNSRNENVVDIISDIQSGIDKFDTQKQLLVIDNRGDAIKKAIELFNDKVVILIAGKGHEKYQISNGETIKFDDMEVTINALKERYDNE